MKKQHCRDRVIRVFFDRYAVSHSGNDIIRLDAALKHTANTVHAK